MEFSYYLACLGLLDHHSILAWAGAATGWMAWPVVRVTHLLPTAANRRMNMLGEASQAGMAVTEPHQLYIGGSSSKTDDTYQ
jgi:hypothetical protein